MGTETLVGMKKGIFLGFAGLLLILSSCSSTPAKPIDQILTETPTQAATSTYTPSPTATQEPLYSLSGVVFFDYNGSGLQDVAYNMDGEAMQEPGIANVPVCLDQNPETKGVDDCVLTAADGSYSIPDIKAGSHKIYVKSPSDEPAKAFRYINKWNGPVVIEVYEMNGVQVPEQHLNDTEVLPIDQYLFVKFDGDDLEQNIALMQGFLTLPFRVEDVPLISAIQGRDHDPRAGYVINYLGDTKICPFPPSCVDGTYDSHGGWDYGIPIGTPLVASIQGELESWTNFDTNGSINLWIQPNISNGRNHETSIVYGHLSTVLINQNQRIYRGQIVALSGNSLNTWSHLDFSFIFGPEHSARQDGAIPHYMDPYGVEDSIPVEYFIERYSAWTVFNNPQHTSEE